MASEGMVSLQRYNLEVGALRNQLNQMKLDVEEALNLVQRHVGVRGVVDPNNPHGIPMFPFREIHTLNRQSINASNTVTFVIDYDEFIAKLHSAKMRVRFRNVRSNIQTAGAGGGHNHQMFEWDSNGSSSFTPEETTEQLATDQSPLNFANVDNQDHIHLYGVVNPATSLYKCKDAGGDPLDFLTLAFAFAEDAYTFDTAEDHTHPLSFGIFEQSYSNPGLSISVNGVDRTTALGGPWNAEPGILDLTEYLRETSGDPIRGAIPIVFSVASSLLDIEATLKSVAFSTELLAAGGT